MASEKDDDKSVSKRSLESLSMYISTASKMKSVGKVESMPVDWMKDAEKSGEDKSEGWKVGGGGAGEGRPDSIDFCEGGGGGRGGKEVKLVLTAFLHSPLPHPVFLPCWQERFRSQSRSNLN